MRDLYFDCRSGISGDMIVAALLALGDYRAFLRSELLKLPLSNYRISIRKIKKKGVPAVKFDVKAGKEKKIRNLNDIQKIIFDSTLHSNVKNLANKIFLTLGKAEAAAHKVSVHKIHFHEVGAIDSIVDIISAAILLVKLDVDRVYSSPISVGTGTTLISHGKVDLPVPAVREILKNAPLVALNIQQELVTPTGAAILKSILTDYLEESPPNLIKKGLGAGTRNLNMPNVLSISICDKKPGVDRILSLETNIDDMNPEVYDYVIEKCMMAGALDVVVHPYFTKKQRVGVQVSVFTKEQYKNRLIEILFSETTTLGIRINTHTRIMKSRKVKTVNTRYGKVRIKENYYKGLSGGVKAEYDDCKKIAHQKKIPLLEVYRAVNEQIDIR